MKKKLLFLLALVLLFILFVVGRYIYVSRTSKEGRLQIISSPTANVIIDNEAVGRTPYESSLAEGEYVIKLVPDQQGASESASWKGKVSIMNNTRTFVSREIGSTDIASSGVILTVQKMDEKPDKKGIGEVEIHTEPDGGIVFLDDEEQGIAPLILSDVQEGDHELSVFSPGFFRRSQKINVKAGFKVIADYKLAVDPTHKKVVKQEKDPEATDEASLEKDSSEKKAITSGKVIEILKTGTGWLRVRAEASLTASESAKVDPGDQFNVLEEDGSWIKIEYAKGEEGWISSQYTREVKEE